MTPLTSLTPMTRLTPQQVFDDMRAQGDMVLDKLDECAAQMPDKVYLRYGEENIRMRFSEVKAQTDRIAAALAAMGLPPGPPVSVLTPNSLLGTLALYPIFLPPPGFPPPPLSFH